MTKRQMALLIEHQETYLDLWMAEWAQNNFDKDGRVRVGPDNRKLNEIKRRLEASCEDV